MISPGALAFRIETRRAWHLLIGRNAGGRPCKRGLSCARLGHLGGLVSRFHVWAGLALMLLLAACSENRQLQLRYDMLWTVPYGASADTVMSVVAGDEGDLVLGQTKKSYQMCVARVDEAGKQRWRRDFAYDPQSSWISAQDVVAYQGSTFVLGSSLGEVKIADETVGQDGQFNAFLLELDETGNSAGLQLFQFDNGQVNAERLALDAAGRIYIAGTFSGFVDFGDGTLTATGNSTFLLALEADGSLRFSRRYGGSWGQVHDIAADPTSGDLFMIGTFNGFINFGTGTLTNGPNGTAVYLARLKNSGEARWAKHYLGNGGFHARFGHGDDILLSGRSEPYNLTNFGGDTIIDGVFVTQLNATTGAHRWTRQFGSNYGGYGSASADIDSAGRIVILAGALSVIKEAQELDEPPYYEQAQYERRRFLVTLDSDGSTMASKTLSQQSDDGYGYGYGDLRLVTVGDTIVLSTKTNEALDFGDGSVHHSGITQLTKLRMHSQ